MPTQTDSKFSLHLDDDDPWPGLAAYDEESRDFFHGRDRDTAELLRLVRLSPFVALYGKSGLGKSSMLLAGLFPQLRAARFLPVHLRLDYTEKAGQPVLAQAAQRLREEIDQAGASAPPFDDGESLWAFLQRREWPIWTRDNYPLTPVLVFDQFEEVFSRGGSAAHVKSVLDGLADLIGDRIPVGLADDHDAARRLNLKTQQYRVVLSFRSDFLAEVESWEKQANLPRRESLHLTAMSRERAIESVSRAGDKVLAPGVAAEIVDFLLYREGATAPGRAAEVEPVLLSLCCYQLNRRRARPARIDIALLHTVGEGILKSFYDEALRDMPPRVSVFIEEHLIQGNRFRSNYPLEEALTSGDLTQQELDHLTDSRLLRVDSQGDAPRVELIHDRLVGVVREARDARLTREAAEERALEERAERERARKEAEQRAQKERDSERLAQTEQERARVARWRNGLAVTVLALVAAVGYILYEVRIDREKAALDRQRSELESDELSSLKGALENDTTMLRASLRTLSDSLKLLTARPQVPVRPDPAPPPQMPTPMTRPSPGSRAPGSLTVERWTLFSGGCLKGEVKVTGPLKVTIVRNNAGVTVTEQFSGTGGGFSVEVNTTRVFDNRRESYRVENAGTWKGPNGRTFTTTGTDDVVADKFDRPISVRLRSIKTVCS